MRSSALAAKVEPPRTRQHLFERPKRLTVPSERLQDVALMVERLEAEVLVRLVAVVKQLETLREELGGLRVRVARPGDTSRLDERRRREGGRASLLAVSCEHLEVLLARVGAI